MSRGIKHGDKVEVIGGQFDGLRGVFAIGEGRLSGAGQNLIVIKGDDNKSYPIPRKTFKELKVINDI